MNQSTRFPSSGMSRASRCALQLTTWSRELPAEFRDDVVSYLLDGKRPTSFVAAVVSGDLYAALEREPLDAPKGSIRKIVGFLKARAPRGAFGSPAALRVWITTGGLRAWQAERA